MSELKHDTIAHVHAGTLGLPVSGCTACETTSLAGQVPFICPDCLRTSHHPTDAAEGYCGNCHAYTGRS